MHHWLRRDGRPCTCTSAWPPWTFTWKWFWHFPSVDFISDWAPAVNWLILRKQSSGALLTPQVVCDFSYLSLADALKSRQNEFDNFW